MIPSILNPEICVTQIEIKDEVKTRKNSDNESTSQVKIRENLKQDSTKEHETNKSEIVNFDNVINEDIAVTNKEHGINTAVENKNSMVNMTSNVKKEQVIYEDPKSNQTAIKPPNYWVQFNFAGGHRMPEYGVPMYYESDRNYFVRYVFAIVLFMLILTSGFVVFVYMTDVRQIFLRFGMILAIVGMVGMLCLNYAMMCSACTRMPPCNFICLFLAVCFMSLITAFITVRYRTQIILLALLATVATVMVCLCLACTNFDFTQYLLYVIVIAAAFSALALIVGIIMLVTNIRYKPLTLVILVVGTLINVVVLILELQMILGGKTVELSEDDYALGAFMLYTSIIDIFLKLVQLLGILDDG